jgi:protein involved in polysaccharide export with SLBB domain
VVALSSCAGRKAYEPSAEFPVAGAHSSEGENSSQDAVNGSVDQDAYDPDVVAPGYLFAISHRDDKVLRGKFRVEFDGTIKLPYQVTIQAAGLTIHDFAKKVNDSYRSFFKDRSSVEVKLDQRKYWIEVRGLVSSPGRYLVSHETSIDEIISQAKGLSVDKDARNELYVKIQRAGQVQMVDLTAYYQSGDASMFPKWRGQELVFFQNGGRDSGETDAITGVVTILGAVNRPGDVTYKSNKDLYYYLTQVGGQSPISDMSEIELVRKFDGKPKSISFNAESSLRFPEIKPGDVLIVGKDTHTTEKAVTVLSGLAAILSTVAVLILAL